MDTIKRVTYGSCRHTPTMVTYYMINVLYSFERESELEYKRFLKPFTPNPGNVSQDFGSQVFNQTFRAAKFKSWVLVV